MKRREQAWLYMRKAREDEILLDEVLHSPRVSDSVIGFHCQQAAGKLCKAVLSWHGCRFRRTHDLLELMDLFDEADIVLPENLRGLDALTPYAVEFRYELFTLDAEMKFR